MNKRRKLKRQLGKKYRYKKFMTAFEVKKLLESQMDKNQERLYASLIIGCVKIHVVLFPTPKGTALGCDIFVKDKPDSEE